MNSNDVYLSYKSICLRKFDVDCFKSNNYLNDMCISFYYELLNDKYKNFDNYFLFDPASISTMVIYDELEDLIDMFGCLNLDQKDYLFIPINDNTDKFSFAGGDHWGLIIYQKSDDTFYYLDSMLNYITNTDTVTNKIKQILAVNSKNIAKVSIDKTLKNKFQFNSFDCGMFVLSFTLAIMEFLYDDNNKGLKLNQDIINDIIKLKVDQKQMKNFRLKILNTISVLSWDW